MKLLPLSSLLVAASVAACGGATFAGVDSEKNDAGRDGSAFDASSSTRRCRSEVVESRFTEAMRRVLAPNGRF